MANNTHVMPKICFDFEKEPETFIKSSQSPFIEEHTPGESAECGYLCRIRSSCGPRAVSLTRIKTGHGEFSQWSAAPAARFGMCTPVAQDTRGNHG
jgi:hypothetical protein